MKYINTNKLQKLKLNKNNIFIVLDFDRTITKFESQDSWDACGRLLDKEFKKKMNEYYEYYRPIEINYSIDIAKKEKYMKEWYYKCIDLYYKYHLTKEKLQKSIKNSKLEFREGAKKLMQKANRNNVPLIILSAGIGNVIEEFLKINDCYFDNMCIISNFIKFNEIGSMKKFDDEMIHTLNKTIEGHLPKEFETKLKDRKFGILVGDLIDDKKMILEDEVKKILSIGFLDNDNNIEVYNKNFDIVLSNKDATFENIEKMVLKNVFK